MCRNGRSTALSIRSAAVWTVLQASRKKSAPAALSLLPCSAQQVTNQIPPAFALVAFDLFEICLRQHEAGAVQAAITQPLRDQFVDDPVIDDRTGPSDAPDDPDGLHVGTPAEGKNSSRDITQLRPHHSDLSLRISSLGACALTTHLDRSRATIAVSRAAQGSRPARPSSRCRSAGEGSGCDTRSRGSASR